MIYVSLLLVRLSCYSQALCLAFFLGGFRNGCVGLPPVAPMVIHIQPFGLSVWGNLLKKVKCNIAWPLSNNFLHG